jgi:AmmeMemoRadiSam system protein B
MEFPKLRIDIQITPFTHQNQRGFILRDSLSEERTLFISEGAALLIPFLDGKHNIQEIHQTLREKTGLKVILSDIKKFIQLLEENFLLDSPAYQKFVEDLNQDYKNSSVRQSLLAGNGYPAKETELTQYLDKIFEGISIDPELTLPKNIRGVVVPHIDIQRGKQNYAQIFSILKRYEAADTYIILGVNHHYLTTNPFIFTSKPYETPLGKLEIDIELLSSLQNNLNWDIFEGELAHKGEHSVEFPVLFLSYTYPKRNIKILPILCNFHSKDDPRIESLIYGLRYYIQNHNNKIILIASVDFSHIGPRFGWEKKVVENDIKTVELQDKKTLGLMGEGDAEGFYNNITSDGNKRHIDALGAGYVFLRTLNNRIGMLINYNQAFDPFNTVTFASLLF